MPPGAGSACPATIEAAACAAHPNVAAPAWPLQAAALLGQLAAVPGPVGHGGGLLACWLWLCLWLQAGERSVPAAAMGFQFPCPLGRSLHIFPYPARPCVCLMSGVLSAASQVGLPGSWCNEGSTMPALVAAAYRCSKTTPCLPLPRTHLQFTRNAFGLSFLLLLLVSLAMTAFGFFVASFLHKVGRQQGGKLSLCGQILLQYAQLGSLGSSWPVSIHAVTVQASAAVPAGFMLFVLAWVILIVVAFGFPYK